MANRRPPGGPKRGPGHASGRGPRAGRPAQPAQARGPAKTNARTEPEPDGGIERLQKVLAHAGVGSRRACEDVILQGRVTVDGKVVRELGTKVDSARSKIAVDGQAIHLERMVYYAVSKPKGYVSTNNDPSGRPRVVDLLPEIPQRVYTVGRLDEMSTGLIILTNDGELANKLAHPKFGVEKIYRVVVAGLPEREVLDKLVEGVWLAEGKVRARRVRIVGKKGQATVLEMVLAEGKNREVRRMLAKLGHKVMSLTRVAVGPITLKGLAPGQHRPLSHGEVELLRKVAAGIAVPARFSERKPKRAPVKPRPSAASGSESRPRRGDAQDHGPQGPRRKDRAPASASGQRPSSRPTGPPRGKPGGARRTASTDADSRRPGPRVILPPEGLPPSQRRPAAQGGPKRPGRPVGPGGEPPPSRRIIGLDPGPSGEGPPRARRKPAEAKRRFPRASLGPRTRRPKDNEEG